MARKGEVRENKCERTGCRHEKDEHKGGKCTHKKSATETCDCPKFIRKNFLWYVKKQKGPICILALGGFLFGFSIFVDTSEIKESTVLSINGKSVVGFYLDNEKDYDVLITAINAGINDLKIYRPSGNHFELDPINEDESDFEKRYSFFLTTEDSSGIYNFEINDMEDNQWVTFVVKERPTAYTFLPEPAAQVLSFVGGGLIGFVISIIQSRYVKLKQEAIT